MNEPHLSLGARLQAHRTVSKSLKSRSDAALGELLAGAAPLGGGIGGATALARLEGHPVFVKHVRLTDLELQTGNMRSTANLFNLPNFCQYGLGRIGAPGFGAWRELAVHVLTTEWVTTGVHEGFPLLHHWRVLSDPGRPPPEELADVEHAVAYWGGGPAIRRRLEGLDRSTTGLVLFLEYIPQNLHDWLGVQVGADPVAAARAVDMVERELSSGISFMNSRGLLHFDAHFENILTDGRRLFFADYGLAISSNFALSPAESAFFDDHASYDRCYAATHLVNWLLVELFGCGPQERAELVRSCAQGTLPDGTPPRLENILLRHGPIAAVLGDFYRRFQGISRATPYPHQAVRRLEQSLDGGLGA
ncbi:protein kinase family protein [Nocardioides aurantiacus]|uniref:protein kinase family protein n=1 Tax=Nocardioides aurantiacus TaxID=86796 RepID=UPI001B868C86|nr:protein kinase family protein [Nocardioides aurantiacus]